MSLNGLFNTTLPLTLSGVQSLDVSSLTIDGKNVDLTALVPYVGATQMLDMGDKNIRTTYTPVTGPDLINLSTLTAAVAFIDGATALTYLNKVTATEQTVTAPTVFNSTVTSAGYYTDTAGYNFGRPSASYNAWGITRIANGGQIRDLQFKDDTAGVDCLLLSSSGQTVYVGLTCNYTTGSKIPIFNADRKLVSSGVDSVKITYLDNLSGDIQTSLNGKANLAGGNSFSGAQNFSDATSDTVAIFNGSKNLSSSVISTTELNYLGGLSGNIQTSLNGKLSLTGGTLTGALSMGSNKVTSSYTPVNADDLTNKAYVDSAITGTGSLYLLKTGGTLTGTVFNSVGDFHPYKAGDTNRGCILFANNQDGASYSNYNGGLASWFGIGFKSTLDSITRFVFDTRSGNSSQTGSFTCAGLTSSSAITVDGAVNVGTRLLGTPDGSPGNFWMGLRGTGTEVERLAISINGSNTTGIVSHVVISKLLYLSAYTANRALYLDGSQLVQASSTTGTELGYVAGVTSGIQGQLDGKATYSYVDTQNNNQNAVIALKADKTYVDTQDAGLQTQINNQATTIALKADKTYVDTQNNAQNTVIATKADTTYVDSQNNAQNTVIATKASTTDLNNGLALKLNLTGGTVTGNIVMNGNKITSTSNPTTADDLTRKGYVDTQDTALQTQINTLVVNQDLYLPKAGGTMVGQLGVAGSNRIEFGVGVVGKDPNAGKIGYQAFNTGCLDIVGAGTSSSNRKVYIYDKLGVGMDARASLDVSGDIITSWANSRIGTQFNTSSSGYYLGLSTNVATRELYLDSQSADLPSSSGAVIIRTGSGPTQRMRVDKDGQIDSGVSGNTLYNLKFANLTSHIDNNAGEVYLFTGFQGHMAIGRNTNRDATTANLCLGVASTEESQIISVKTDNSAYMPMSFAASRYSFTGGAVTISNAGRGWIHQNGAIRLESFVDANYGWLGTHSNHPLAFYTNNSNPLMTLSTGGNLGIGITNPSCRLDVRTGTGGNVLTPVFQVLGGTSFDASNIVNFQCQASQYGRNILHMTGRYEGSNDAWTFDSPRNAIIFRTQSYLDSPYTNRWTIQNFDDGLGFLASNTPTMVLKGSNVGIGSTVPAYKLDVIGDVRSSTSLLFGTNGSYASGCIYSDINWGMICRSKQSSPGLAHFLWSTADDTHMMRISPIGVLNFYGGTTPYAVPNGLATTAGALVIGGISINYNDGWNAGLLMECQNTTSLTIHDSGARLASFMYYNGANKFLMGKDAGFGTTPIDIQGDLYLDNPPYTSTYGVPQAGMTLGWDLYTGLVTNTPIEYYKSGPSSSSLQINWNGMNRTNQFYKGTVSSAVLVNGYATAYRTSSGFQDIHIRFYNNNTFQFFTFNSYVFYNVANNHAPIPVNINVGNLPSGWYDVYCFFVSAGQATDGNDFISLSYEIFPNGIQSA